MSMESELLDQWLDEQRKVFPADMNRASEAGHRCERFLFYRRTAWQEAEVPSRRLQAIFIFGRDYEQWLRRRMGDAGYMFRQPSRPLEWRQFQLRGTDDGDVSWDEGKTWHLHDIKGLHPNYWLKYEKWQDFLESAIYCKYPAQLQLYMLLLGKEDSYFLLGRKGSLDVRWMKMELDYEYAESILAKLERVNAAVAAGEPPPQLNDTDVCDRCDFRNHCQPAVFTTAARITDEREVIELVETREYLGATRRDCEKAYKRTDAAFREAIGEQEVTIAGPWQVIRKITKGKNPHPRYTIRRLDTDAAEEEDLEDDDETGEPARVPAG